MGSRAHFTVIGLFVVLLAAAGLGIFYWLSVHKHDETYKTYLLFVHEDVSGLSVQSSVRFNGVRVGYVDQIILDPTNPQLVRIILNIAEGTPITTATVATLNSQGITGVVYVGLKATQINAPPLLPKPGEKYPVIPARPSLLVQLSEVLPQITQKIQVVGDSIAALLNQQNRAAVADTLQHISKFTEMLADNSHKLDETIAALNATMKNTAQASDKFPQAMKQFQETLQSIKAATNSINQAAGTFSYAMKSGKVAINNFSSQVVPSTQELLQRLNRMTQHLEVLSQELQQNPSVIIRGKAPMPPGPGEQ